MNRDNDQGKVLIGRTLVECTDPVCAVVADYRAFILSSGLSGRSVQHDGGRKPYFDPAVDSAAGRDC